MTAITGAASKAAKAVKESSVATAALEKGKVVADKVPDGVKQAAKDGAEKAKDKAMDMYKEQTQRFDRLKGQWKEMLEKWIKMKIHRQISKLVDKLPGIIKSVSDDPDMPGFVKSGKDRTIDAVWPDVREEILWEIAVFMDGEKYHKAEEKLDDGPWCFRRFFRYHLYPNDKTIWGKLRDPVWVIFLLMSFIPVHGVAPLMFLFIFLIIDKRDEFQLIYFILQFKGFMFITQGIVRTILGFFTYIDCVSAKASPDEHHCETDGPGVRGTLVLMGGGFLLQVILVWIAFAFLPWSEEKGRTELKTIEVEHTGHHSVKGGYIRYFLLYDMFVFILCVAVLGYVVSMNDPWDRWPVRHSLFACQVVYGYMSFPFFFFTLPFLQPVLTHAVATAYDHRGRCRKLIKPSMEKKRLEEKPREEDVLLDEEADKFFERIKASLFGSGKVDLSDICADVEGARVLGKKGMSTE